MKLKAVIAVSVLAIAAATGGWMYYRYESAPKNLELYGNVDIRQVNLAFLWPERIKSILVEEGDFVKAGQPVAEQETDTLKIEIEQAKAAEQAAYQTYLALKNGSRPEDIAKAEAAVLVAQSRLHLAQKDFERVDGLFKSTKGQGVSKQSLDTQSSQLQVAKNELFSAQKSLELAKIGPRAEDVARAYAQWQQTKAQVAQLELMRPSTQRFVRGSFSRGTWLVLKCLYWPWLSILLNGCVLMSMKSISARSNQGSKLTSRWMPIRTKKFPVMSDLFLPLRSLRLKLFRRLT